MPESHRTPRKKTPTQKQRLLRVYTGLGGAALLLLLTVLLLPGGPRSGGPEGGGPEGGEPQVSERYPEDEVVTSPQREAEPPADPEAGTSETAEGAGSAAQEQGGAPMPKRRGSLAIVIDDVGNSLAELEPFLELDMPLTLAVLPQRKYSREAAGRAVAAGKEVILHLPMEPVSDMDPGPGAIRVGMSPGEITTTLEQNLASVPGIRGVNNHMGSRATADPLVMDTVLTTLKKEGLFYLDSRTSVETVGPATAEKHNLPYLERAVFLDNESNRDYIRNAVREGMQIAERKGHAVMIGHVMVNEVVEVLAEMYPFIQDEGFDLRYLSELVLTPEFDDDPRS